jgi:hypothetical protein
MTSEMIYHFILFSMRVMLIGMDAWIKQEYDNNRIML